MKSIYERLETQDLQKAINNTRVSMRKRDLRIKRRILKMFEEEECFFLTFTLADEFINLKMRTYWDKIKESLKYVGIEQYIVNEDYGTHNSRLHFHAVVGFKNVRLKDLYEIWKYGSINFKPITRKTEKSIRLYIQKLASHSIKENTGKIIFSRNKYSTASELEIERLQKIFTKHMNFAKIESKSKIN